MFNSLVRPLSFIVRSVNVKEIVRRPQFGLVSERQRRRIACRYVPTTTAGNGCLFSSVQLAWLVRDFIFEDHISHFLALS